MPLTIGTHLGSHEITALLGKGGMGEVYRAKLVQAHTFNRAAKPTSFTRERIAPKFSPAGLTDAPTGDTVG